MRFHTILRESWILAQVIRGVRNLVMHRNAELFPFFILDDPKLFLMRGLSRAVGPLFVKTADGATVGRVGVGIIYSNRVDRERTRRSHPIERFVGPVIGVD